MDKSTLVAGPDSDQNPPIRRYTIHPAACFLITLVGSLWWLSSYRSPSVHLRSESQSGIVPFKIYHCAPPPIPIEFLGGAPASDHGFYNAGKALHKMMSLRSQGEDMDSLSIAVVTPSDTLFERQYGVLKANGTSEIKGVLNPNSLYRIASISKMFASLEMMILRERGLLSLYAARLQFPDISADIYEISFVFQ